MQQIALGCLGHVSLNGVEDVIFLHVESVMHALVLLLKGFHLKHAQCLNLLHFKLQSVRHLPQRNAHAVSF